MIDVLKKILEQKNFSVSDYLKNDEKIFHANRIDNFGFDFLTVLFIDEEKFLNINLLEYIENLFDIISQQSDLKMGWDKNLSLLIMLKVNQLNLSPKIQSLIFDIEEEPFMFKKYILPYTDRQQELFKTQLENYEGRNEIAFLEHVLYNSKNFSVFKARNENEDFHLYDLVSKLYIKIPYLNIVNQNKEVKSLLNDIVYSFTEEEKALYKNLIVLREIEDLNGKEGDGSGSEINKILEVIGVIENE